MRVSVVIFLIILAVTVSGRAQSFEEDLTKARNIRVLNATAEDVVRTFADRSPFDFHNAFFSRPSTLIKISYSSGTCNNEESFGVDANDWNVAAGRAVIVDVQPRDNIQVAQLNLGVRLQKDRLYRGIDNYHIYYN